MKYIAKINGIEVEAYYSDQCIDQILLPLLYRLNDMQKKKQGRILVMLAAPPGTGKSTLSSFLQYLSEANDLEPLTVIGMDGFHRYQSYLLSHEIVRDGKMINMVDVKGAPETFDLDKLESRIRMIKKEDVCLWPGYDRVMHNPKEDDISVSGNIVLLEGNYLLLDEDGWRDIRNYADYTIAIKADIDVLRERLIARKMNSCISYEHARRFVESSDLYNARTCLEKTMKADLNLLMNNDGEYCLNDK